MNFHRNCSKVRIRFSDEVDESSLENGNLRFEDIPRDDVSWPENTRFDGQTTTSYNYLSGINGEIIGNGDEVEMTLFNQNDTENRLYNTHMNKLKVHINGVKNISQTEITDDVEFEFQSGFPKMYIYAIWGNTGLLDNCGWGNCPDMFAVFNQFGYQDKNCSSCCDNVIVNSSACFESGISYDCGWDQHRCGNYGFGIYNTLFDFVDMNYRQNYVIPIALVDDGGGDVHSEYSQSLNHVYNKFNNAADSYFPYGQKIGLHLKDKLNELAFGLICNDAVRSTTELYFEGYRNYRLHYEGYAIGSDSEVVYNYFQKGRNIIKFYGIFDSHLQLWVIYGDKE